MSWVNKWKVPSLTRPAESYVVSQSEDGNWGCSCPVWKFRRLSCKHIERVQESLMAKAAAGLQVNLVGIAGTSSPSRPKKAAQQVGRRLVVEDFDCCVENV